MYVYIFIFLCSHCGILTPFRCVVGVATPFSLLRAVAASPEVYLSKKENIGALTGHNFGRNNVLPWDPIGCCGLVAIVFFSLAPFKGLDVGVYDTHLGYISPPYLSSSQV